MSPDAESELLSPAAIEAGFRTAERDLGQFNLGIFGITGAGKSTLLNAVFGVQLATTGIGAPITQSSTLHRTTASSLGIFDTKGLELGTHMADTLAELRRFVDTNRLGPESDQLHVIWYCIRAGDRRIQPAEQEFIRGVSSIGIPVMLVMTQVALTGDGRHHPEAVELAEAIRVLKLPVRGDIFFVNALADDFAGVGVHGLDTLLDFTEQVAPEGVRNALAAAQQVNARLKGERAEQVVIRATNLVRAKALKRKVTGETWVAMFAEIAAIYGLSEAQSREVLESSNLIPRLRKWIWAANAGVFMAPTVAVAGVTASAVANAGRGVGARWRARRAAKADAEAGAGVEGAQPLAAAAGGQPAEADKKSLGVGWVGARITRDLGEAWTSTCERRWADSYPAAPTTVDTGELAAQFTVELGQRSPLVRRRGGRRQRHSLQE